MPYSLIRQINRVEMSILSKLLYRLNGFCIKISGILFMDRNNIIMKFKWKYRDIKRGEPCLKQKNELKRLISPNINIYASTIIKTALYWQRINAQVSGQVNDMEMKSHKYAPPFFFNKAEKTIQWRKDKLSTFKIFALQRSMSRKFK